MILFSVTILAGCGVEYYAAGNFPKRYITYGTTTGGEYGIIENRVLLPNGMLFGNQMGDVKYSLLTEIQRSEAKDLIKAVAECGIKDRKVNKPGKLSYFLTYVEKDVKYEWIWGQSVTSEPAEVKEIIQKLRSLVPQGAP